MEAFKQARRRDDDIAIVSCCFRVHLEQVQDQPSDKPVYKVLSANCGYGGMSVKVVAAHKTEQFLVGRTWDKSMFPKIYDLLEEDLPLPPGAPGGMIEYRRTLTTSFFFKFYLGVVDKLHTDTVGYVLNVLQTVTDILLSDEEDMSFKVPAKYRSAIEHHHRPLSHGEQHYQTKPYVTL